MRNSRAKTLRSRIGSRRAPEDMLPPGVNLSSFPRPTPKLQATQGGRKVVNVVDLFCGCGGLSLGFEKYDGSVEFRSVLAVDNDPASLRVFNQNRARPTSTIDLGRLADLTWFSHRSEALLFYLSHFAASQSDLNLQDSLNEIGFGKFLNSLRSCDQAFATQARQLTSGQSFIDTFRAVDSTAWNLALVKSILRKLGIASFRTAALDYAQLPWSFEYTNLERHVQLLSVPVQQTIVDAAETLWCGELNRLENAASSVGKGQHVPVARKASEVLQLLSGEAGRSVRDIWISWRARRDSIRANYCLSVEHKLRDLYLAGRQVGLLLGGPPCKGWSRIGRAVIEHLREQGVHAWASHDYGDARNALLHNYVLFLDALRPEAFLFENVAHFESSLRTPSGLVNAAQELQRALNGLDHEAEYEVSSQVLSAKQFGIPQDRSRYIMVGVRTSAGRESPATKFFHSLSRFDDEVPLRTALQGLEEPGVFTHGKVSCSTAHRSKTFRSIDPRMPAAEIAYLTWIGHGVRGDELSAETDAHITREPRPDDARLFKFLAPGTRWMDYKVSNLPTTDRIKRVLDEVSKYQADHKSADLPSVATLRAVSDLLDDSLLLRLLLEGLAESAEYEHHLLQSGYLAKGSDRHGDWLERLSPDHPCKTIVAHIGKDTYAYIHPTQPRAISIREAARIQTFPDTFSFGNAGVVDAYSMIGNAVPPMLAHEFAATMARLDDAECWFSVSSASEPELLYHAAIK